MRNRLPVKSTMKGEISNTFTAQPSLSVYAAMNAPVSRPYITPMTGRALVMTDNARHQQDAADDEHQPGDGSGRSASHLTSTGRRR